VTPGNVKVLADKDAAEEVVEDTASNRTLRMLIVLAAASGMRLGEILGLSVSNVSEDGTILKVEEKAFRSEVQDFLKTKNGKRLVDLDLGVGKMLREFIGNRTGLGFCTRTGKPLSQSNILKRQLHPLLKELGAEICGAHAFRLSVRPISASREHRKGWSSSGLVTPVRASQMATTAFAKTSNIEYRKECTRGRSRIHDSDRCCTNCTKNRKIRRRKNRCNCLK
jgi:integrase